MFNNETPPYDWNELYPVDPHLSHIFPKPFQNLKLSENHQVFLPDSVFKETSSFTIKLKINMLYGFNKISK